MSTRPQFGLVLVEYENSSNRLLLWITTMHLSSLPIRLRLMVANNGKAKTELALNGAIVVVLSVLRPLLYVALQVFSRAV